MGSSRFQLTRCGKRLIQAVDDAICVVLPAWSSGDSPTASAAAARRVVLTDKVESTLQAGDMRLLQPLDAYLGAVADDRLFVLDGCSFCCCHVSLVWRNIAGAFAAGY